jgi:DNA-binding GntR family transcriptional regulator
MLDEISSMRSVLEQFVCRRVLERWTPAAAAELGGLARRMTSAAERGTTKTVCDLDMRFHERLWQLADHALLEEVAAGLRVRMESWLRAVNEALVPDELFALAREHVELVELLASGDEAAASELMRRHVEMGAQRVAGLRKERLPAFAGSIERPSG